MAHCSRVARDSSRKRLISSPAMALGCSRRGRVYTGSMAYAVTWSGVSMFDALLCASTTTTSKAPVAICMWAAATLLSPSAVMVCMGRSMAPSWSGVYSSKMLACPR